MAKLTPGIGWSEARGSVGGSTYCRSSSGLVMRARSLGPSTTTIRQKQSVARLSAASARWRELTEAQRRQWRTAAETNALIGYRPGLSGHQLFVAVASFLAEQGLGPPTVPDLRPPPVLTSVGPVTRIGTGTTFQIDYTRTTPPTGQTLIRVSAPAPTQLSATRNPAFHRVVSLSASTFSSGLSIATAWWSVAGGEYDGLGLIWEFVAFANTGQKSPPIRRYSAI